jgi:integrase
MRKPPSYRLHRGSGQAVVTIDGRDIYLGKYRSLESRGRYERLIATWRAGNGRMPASDGVLIDELVARYLDHARAYYRKNGEPTSSVRNAVHTLAPLSELYGDTAAGDFKPSDLKAVRQRYIDAGLALSEVNRRHSTLVRVFRWATGEQMVPGTVLTGLEAVARLRPGRCEVRVTEPVGPVDDETVELTIPYCSETVAAMIRLQQYTGMRPGEVVIIRTCDISDDLGWYTPSSHKTEHRDRRRKVALGPRARAILEGRLRPEAPDAFLFTSYASTCELRARRRTAAYREQESRAGRMPGRPFKEDGYYHSIRKSILRANRDRAARGLPPIEHWFPHQLRHTYADKVERRFGEDHARAAIGQADLRVTRKHYLTPDDAKAADAAAELG